MKAKSILQDKQLNYIPLYMGVYEVFIIITSIPMGILSDKINKYTVILIGLIVLLKDIKIIQLTIDFII